MKRIIIADDSVLARMFTSRLLSVAGYTGFEIEEAKDGQEVFALMMEAKPDLVISDLNMPEMDGLELMTHISQNQDLSSVPVIIVTSAGNQNQRTELLALGARAILSKPLVSDELVSVIGDILEREEEGYGF